MVVSAFDYYQEKPTEEQLDPWWKNLVPTVSREFFFWDVLY